MDHTAEEPDTGNREGYIAHGGISGRRTYLQLLGNQQGAGQYRAHHQGLFLDI